MDKVPRIDLAWCDNNDATIPHALCIEKNIVYYVISFREGRYGFRKPQYRITLFEINRIMTDNIDGYIINVIIFTVIFIFVVTTVITILFIIE